MSQSDEPSDIIGPPTRESIDFERIKRQYELYLELRDVLTPKKPKPEIKFEYHRLESGNPLTTHWVGGTTD